MQPSWGKTTTPKTGWGCCTLPPCCGSKHDIYTSDNHKTWGETGRIVPNCCKPPHMEDIRVKPGGQSYKYELDKQGCCGPVQTVISRNGAEVGRSELMCYACPCGKPAVSVTRHGAEVYTLRYPSCCGGRKSGGCCGPSRGCCDPWARYDLLDIHGPGEGEGEPVAVVSNQWHKCCPFCFPAWVGFDRTPSADEDDMALLGVFVLQQRLYNRTAMINTDPATIGGMA